MKILGVIGIIAVSVALSLLLNFSIMNFTGMAIKDTAKYSSATWTCPDGTIKTESMQLNTECKTSSEWRDFSVNFCSSHCKSISKNVRQCNPSKFTLGTKCNSMKTSESEPISNAFSSNSSSSSSSNTSTSTNAYSESEASSIPISSSWSGTNDIDVNTFNILVELDSCPKLYTNPGQSCKTVCEASHLKCVLALSRLHTPFYDAQENTPERERRRQFVTNVGFGECNYPAGVSRGMGYDSPMAASSKVYTDACVCC